MHPPESRHPGRTNRRTFLARTGAILAAPMIVPSSVLGLNGAVAPSNRITIGFIGTGRQCIYANIPLFLKEKDAQAVAVCDVDAWRMNLAREQIENGYARERPSGSYKGCAEINDWRELLARKDIDAVMISTPDHWHALQAIAALKAGKDVACEKPLTRTIAEGRLLADTVAKTGRVFRTDSEFRSSRPMHRLAQLARNGKLGKIERIITVTPRDGTLPLPPAMAVPPGLDYEMWLGPAPHRPYTEKRVHPRNDAKSRPGWIAIRDYADGMLANWGAHLNDIAMWGNDTEHTGPAQVEATGTWAPKGHLWDVIQDFEAHFIYANGVRLTCRTGKPSIRFEGTEGWMQVNYPTEVEASAPTLLSWTPGPNDIVLPFKSSEKRDFLDAVKSRQQPLYTAEGGHRNASLSHLMIAAIESGRKFRWDPAKEEASDATVNKLLLPKPMRGPWKLEG